MALPAPPSNVTYSSITVTNGAVKITTALSGQATTDTVIIRGDMALWDDTSQQFLLPENTNWRNTYVY